MTLPNDKLNMRFSIILLFFIFKYTYSFGYEITGIIKDSISNDPVENATIHINGTTIGTTSDLNGMFKLVFDIEICQIAINHINYESVLINYNESTTPYLNIKLNPKRVLITEVEVGHSNMRSLNLEYFKTIFLGVDEWGKSATILNDSVIFFNVTYNNQKLYNRNDMFDCFEVFTTVPLQIQLPKLGYILEYDLVKFNESYNQDLGIKTLQILGYSYYKEIKPLSGINLRRISKNRLDAYYNSTMHFMRSLYSNTLEENGYKIYQLIQTVSKKTGSDELAGDSLGRTDQPVNAFKFMDKYVVQSDSVTNFIISDAGHREDERYLSGFRGNMYAILYYGSNGILINTSGVDKKEAPISRSNMIFAKDTCTIRKDGSLPGGEIIFGGELVKKRIGAALPYDIKF